MTTPWLSESPSHDTINAGHKLTWQGRERRWPWLEWFLAKGDGPSITSLPGEGPAGPGKPTSPVVMGLAQFLTPRDGLKGLGRAGGYFMQTLLLKECYQLTPSVVFGFAKPPARPPRNTLGHGHGPSSSLAGRCQVITHLLKRILHFPSRARFRTCLAGRRTRTL